MGIGPSRSGGAGTGAEALFVSDLHLHPALAETTRLFEHFLSTEAPHADRLFLLGDIFEYWAGDDDIGETFNQRIVEAIRRVVLSGTKVFWVGGNRDFLVGDVFARESGVTLLPDPFGTTLGGRTIAVSHGDALCTDDVDYQSFRSMVRDPVWQRVFLEKPLFDRKAIIAGLRSQSKAGKMSKTSEIMDVNEDAVCALFRETGAEVLIHGHTHRPGKHASETCAGHVRFVLPDWDGDETPCRGGWLAIEPNGEIKRFSLQGELVDFACP